MPAGFASQNELLGLAPTYLRNRLATRYLGNDHAIPLTDFVAADQAVIHRLYHFLQVLLPILQCDTPEREVNFARALEVENLEDLVGQLQGFGQESYRVHPTPLMAETIHDLRGGGLTPLLGHLSLHALGGPRELLYEALYFLTRDHLKIMRNALLGLDDAKRNEDLRPKVHGTAFIVEKWHGARLAFGPEEKTLEVDCPHQVAIAECCVEFGALDRILYNLLNNACRHAASNQIQLSLLPVPDEDGENLRFVVLNAVSPDDRARLQDTDLKRLFAAGVSTTGSGYGLYVAAEFVASAYGLPSTDRALADQYLGATLLDDVFAAWFHWPIVREH